MSLSIHVSILSGLPHWLQIVLLWAAAAAIALIWWYDVRSGRPDYGDAASWDGAEKRIGRGSER